MPLPALLVNPWTLGIIGSFLPSIASAVLGSKSKEEAQSILAPERQRMVAALIAEGADPGEAEQQADAALEGELVGKMQEGALPGWAEAGLGVVGGGVGGLAGAAFKKGGMSALKSMLGLGGKQADELVSPFPGRSKLGPQRPPEAAVTRETPDPEYMRRRRNANQAEMEMGRRGDFDQPYSRMPEPGEVRDVALRPIDTLYPDELVAPFPSMRGQSPRMFEAEFSLPPERPRGIGRTPQDRIGYEPEVGSPPPAQPMSPREEFRRDMAADVRSQPNTPPIVRRQRAALPYDESADVAKAMRESDIPDVSLGSPADDIDELTAWAKATGQRLRAEDIDQLRRRMSRY